MAFMVFPLNQMENVTVCKYAIIHVTIIVCAKDSRRVGLANWR